jgi:hypothetical protein
LLFDEIRSRKPDFKAPNLNNWARHVDLMIRRDKRKPARVEEVIRWCQRDEFWQNNILSTAKLRKQFDKLELAMDKQRGPSLKPIQRGPGPAEDERFKAQLDRDKQSRINAAKERSRGELERIAK